MNDAIVLDSGPVGLLTQSRQTALVVAAHQWLKSLVGAGRRVILPEIANYEVRRELVRIHPTRGLHSLDVLKQTLEYQPIDTTTMTVAANYWALARNQGQPTAPDPAL